MVARRERVPLKGHIIQGHPTGPNIAFPALKRISIGDLRGKVIIGPSSGGYLITPVLHNKGDPEVPNLQLVGPADQQILRLYVPMDHPHTLMHCKG